MFVDFKLDCPCGFQRSELEVYERAGYFKKELAVIDLESDYHNLIGGHKKNVQREAKKCESKGYFVRLFDFKSYITEAVEIHQSKLIRCERPMTESYMKSVTELGGQISQRREVEQAKCKYHNNENIGIFSSESGFWGDGKLVGYISLNYVGNFVNYGRIIGHGDYLKDGIMHLLHLKTLEYLKNGFTRFVVYFQYNSGTQNLIDWKRRAGFREHKLRFI